MMKPANDDPQAEAGELRRRGEELIARLARATTAAESAELRAQIEAFNAEIEAYNAAQTRMVEELKESVAANKAELRRRGIDPDSA